MLEDIFHILRNIPTIRAARKENCGRAGEGWRGSCRIKPETRDLQFLWGSASANIIVLSNWRVLRGLQ